MDLFGWAKQQAKPRSPYNGEPPSQAHSPTSIAAAEAIKPVTGRLHKVIVAALTIAPATDEELCERTGMGGNTERPRRRELQLAGTVVDSGRTRPTRSGKDAVVWRLA